MGKSVSRREVLKSGTTAIAAGGLAVLGTPTPMPEVKRIRGRDLLLRGEPEWYSGDELKFIGLPIGGFFAGTVYLGGDGQLWNWDIFNQERLGCVERTPTTFMGETLTAMGGANYVDPVRQQSPFNQRFELTLNNRAIRFGDIRFRGEYPIGRVEYKQADADVEMSLVAFSPFCPLDAENSSYPAVTMTFTVRNVGKAPLTLRMQYRTDNPVLAHSRKNRSDFNLLAQATGTNGVLFSATEIPPGPDARLEVVFADWADGTYGAWKATGTAFGDRPQRVDQLPSYMGPVHAGTIYVVNTHQTRNGEDVGKADTHVGTLRSPEFKIDRKFINLRVGGGNHKGGTCVNLVVEGQIVRSVTGRNSNAMNWEAFAVGDFQGKTAYLEVVDNITGGWGQISLGEVIFADLPRTQVPLAEAQDIGTFCVEVIGAASAPKVEPNQATIGREFTLAPGASETITFVVAWHFPNCAKNLPGRKHWYAKRWADAQAVANDLVENWRKLRDITFAWNQTWYDSTLPYWFLDRSFMNTSILATTTCYRLDEGRYYFWEGVGCCAGTCTHVWGYAQAIGRVFPEIERYLRKEIDYGIAYRPDTGAIDYRAEFHQTVAVDGQASCILRTYREHLMSRDDTFLRGIWPKVKGSMEYLIRMDLNDDGILDGAQYNTLDTAWFGQIAWISSLYVAALRASEAMATEMGDPAFAAKCKELAEKGSKRLVGDLFDGEYFINKVDKDHPEANNTNVGCHIDQIYGQSWALQVGLPRVAAVLPTKKALASLFKYSFYEDVWEYRRQNKAIPGGRWYANPKEPGLIMCSFPKGGAAESIGKSGDAWAVGYFNECMSGFEYQVANHMIAEDMVTEGMTIVRAIHERYHASKRNPYNEIECSDHYGRAMASYGAFVAITGFQCHGPQGTMSFAPKVAGKFAFINERGWGTFSGNDQVAYRYRDGELVR